MLNSRSTFNMAEFSGQVPEELTVLGVLTGFTDAGSVSSQLIKHLLDNLEHEVLIDFQNDELFDYRARRPMLFFNGESLEDYEPPSLKLYLVKDKLDNPFLLLAGYEPDFRWEAFVHDVMEVVQHFKAKNFLWFQGLPMPVPHTRDIGVTVSGNMHEVIDSHTVWKPKTKIPANVLQVLEYHFQQDNFDVAGFSLLLPHYLSDNTYPTGLIAALDRISAVTGLFFSYEDVREQEAEFLGKLAEQLDMNSDLERMLDNLEKRHDQYMLKFQFSQPSSSAEFDPDDLEIPSADDLAAEFEQYLASHNDPNENDKDNRS